MLLSGLCLHNRSGGAQPCASGDGLQRSARAVARCEGHVHETGRGERELSKWRELGAGVEQRHETALEHHGAEREAIDKNFAVHLPVLDYLFGTFHMPKDRWPASYGISGGAPVPQGYLRQTIHPIVTTTTDTDLPIYEYRAVRVRP